MKCINQLISSHVEVLKPFLPNVPFWFPWKHQLFSDIFRGSKEHWEKRVDKRRHVRSNEEDHLKFHRKFRVFRWYSPCISSCSSFKKRDTIYCIYYFFEQVFVIRVMPLAIFALNFEQISFILVLCRIWNMLLFAGFSYIEIYSLDDH